MSAFVERLFSELADPFNNEGSQPETRKLPEALCDKGFGGTELDAIKRMIDAEKCDLWGYWPTSRSRLPHHA
jgi:hypothetical protein